jgi:hypothetical protein
MAPKLVQQMQLELTLALQAVEQHMLALKDNHLYSQT